MEKRFTVTLSLDIKENTKDGATEDFFNSAVTYPNIGYDGVVGIEQAMLDVLNKLGEAGVKKAAAMGFADKMKQVGFLK